MNIVIQAKQKTSYYVFVFLLTLPGIPLGAPTFEAKKQYARDKMSDRQLTCDLHRRTALVTIAKERHLTHIRRWQSRRGYNLTVS